MKPESSGGPWKTKGTIRMQTSENALTVRVGYIVKYDNHKVKHSWQLGRPTFKARMKLQEDTFFCFLLKMAHKVYRQRQNRLGERGRVDLWFSQKIFIHDSRCMHTSHCTNNAFACKHGGSGCSNLFACESQIQHLPEVVKRWPDKDMTEEGTIKRHEECEDEA
nr:cleavage and polyadenylation specificity factor subunit 1 [Tanacetum cinerariifolium]